MAIQTNLNLVEIGNVQAKSGTMEMIFVSLRNQGWNPGFFVNLEGFGIEIFGILWGWFWTPLNIQKSKGVIKLFRYEAVFTCVF